MYDIPSLTADDRTVGVGVGLCAVDELRKPSERDVQTQDAYHLSFFVADGQTVGGGLLAVFALFIRSYPAGFTTLLGDGVPGLLEIGGLVVVVALDNLRTLFRASAAGVLAVLAIGIDDELAMEIIGVHGDGAAHEHGVVFDHLPTVAAQGLRIVQMALYVPSHHPSSHFHLPQHVVDVKNRTVECQRRLRQSLFLHCLMREVVHDRQRGYNQDSDKRDDPEAQADRHPGAY